MTESAGFGALARTVLHLRPRQITGQLRRRLSGPATRPSRHRVPGARLDAVPAVVGPSPDAAYGAAGVALCGKPPFDPIAAGWSAVGDPLWLYTLHYHGWITHPDTPRDVGLETIMGWIAQHTAGVGWEPYPTSMRMLHWVSWLGRHGPSLRPEQSELIGESLAAQLVHLSHNLEIHIDGNHLWTNLAAVAVGSMVLTGRRIPDRSDALSRFGTVVRDQLADDGVHLERTPTYHCVLAEQLGMVSNLAQLRAPSSAISFARTLQTMTRPIAAFTHPDGDVALWGDSRLGAPARPFTLQRRLGIRPDDDLGPKDASQSGFHRRDWGPWALLFNRGDVGMPHQPGHLHGDALAIELSFRSTRVVVDAGVGTYRPGHERRYARSSPAHNTVTLDSCPEHHEMWASHRVGGRASTRSIEIAPRRLSAAVRAFRGPAEHVREIERVGDLIVMRDEVSPCVPAFARLHFPATLDVTLESGGALVETPQGRFRVHGSTRHWWIEPAAGWHDFGVPASRVCLATELDGGRLTTVFEPL